MRNIFCLHSVRIKAYAVGMVALVLESLAMQSLDVARMRELRKKLDLTQAEAAERADMTVSRWNDIEAGGRSNVTIDTLSAIAAALGVDARDLITPAKKGRKG